MPFTVELIRTFVVKVSFFIFSFMTSLMLSSFVGNSFGIVVPVRSPFYCRSGGTGPVIPAWPILLFGLFCAGIRRVG